MRNSSILLLLIAISFSSCKSNEEKQENEMKTSDTTIVDSHNSKNSLDWQGTYQGTLPCADCEGIDATVVLNDDSTYEITYKYLGREDNIYRERGEFTWDDAGGKITMSNQENPNSGAYLVGENQLIQLDGDGNRIEGDLASRFILKKK